MTAETRATDSTSDKLASFCADCIARHTDAWPIGEAKLAREFLTHFKMFSRFGVLPEFWQLNQVCSEIGIELAVEELPEDLLGLNCRLGCKRMIAVSSRPEYQFVLVHTVLHEIRELLERVFCDLGFPTVPPDELDSRADEFGSFVMSCAAEGTFVDLFEGAASIESKWCLVGATVLIGICFLATAIRAQLCRTYLQLPESVRANLD